MDLTAIDAVHPTGVHKDIDKECWLVPELHPQEHDSASSGILHDLLGASTGNLQLPALNRRPELRL